MKLRCENLVKKYGPRTVVKGVSMEVSQGEIVGFLGPNGAGKTTSFYMITGLIVPNAGRIYLDDEEITGLPMFKRAQKGVGYLAQEASVFRHMSVEDNIMSVMEMSNQFTKEERKQRLEDLLDEFNLHKVRKSKGIQLSGGERRRCEIARALAMKPEVMLFDEPTSALDPTMVDEVESVIRRLVDAGMTSMIVTHEMRFAKNIASNVMFMAEQGIYEHGTAEEVIGHPSKELTRRFMYRARMFERNVTKDDIDIYSLCSEIRQFALSFGLTARQSRGIEYLCDELLLPLLRSDKNGGHHAVVQVIAGENTADYQVILQFPTLAADPLESDIMDEMGRKIVSAFTKSLKSEKNAEGLWEVHAEL